MTRQIERAKKSNFLVNRILLFAVLAFLALEAPVHARAYSDSEIRSVETSEEAELRSIRNQEINQLRIALGRRVASNRRADLYLRLAELYLEFYRAAFLVEGKAHEKRVSEGSKELMDRSYSRPYLTKGIQACEEILKLRIPFAQMDQVYYFLGFNNGELGQEKKSFHFYHEIAVKYPNSEFAYEALRELGEKSYKMARFGDAKKYFEIAISKKQNESTPRVLYRLAWSNYRLKNYGEAARVMKQAVELSKTGGEKFVSIKEEGLKDLAVFLTEKGDAKGALEYYQNVVGDQSYYAKALEKLGREYERQLKLDQALKVYETLEQISKDPWSRLSAQARRVEIELNRKHFEAALIVLSRVKVPEGSPDEDSALTDFKNFKALVRRTATSEHNEYRKRLEKLNLNHADSFYSVYANEFLKDKSLLKERNEILMYLAEVKREKGQPLEASRIYRNLVQGSDEEYSKKAGVYWLGSVADSLKEKAKDKPAQNSQPSDLELQFIEASDLIHSSLPQSKEAKESQLRSAQILAGYAATLPQAIERTDRLVREYSGDSQAVTAALLKLQILNDRIKQEKGEENVSREIDLYSKNDALLKADQAFEKGKLKTEIDRLRERLRLSELERAEKSGDKDRMVKAYETYAATTGDAEKSEKALSNAYYTLLKSKSTDEAYEVLKRWGARFSKSEKYSTAYNSFENVMLVLAFEDSKALARLENKVINQLNNQPYNSAQVNYFVSLARFFDARGSQVARKIVERLESLLIAQVNSGTDLKLLRFKPKSKILNDFYLESNSLVGKIISREQEILKYKKCMQIVPTLESVECAVRLAQIYEKEKDTDLALSAFAEGDRLVAEAKALKQVSPYSAFIRYRIAQFKEEKVTVPKVTSDLAATIPPRISAIEKIGEAYAAAAELGGPWGVAAATRTFQLIDELADEVSRINTPDSAKFAAKFKAASVVKLNESYQKAASGDFLTTAVIDITDRLARSQKIGRAQGVYPRLKSAGSEGSEKSFSKLLENPVDATNWLEYSNFLKKEEKIALSRAALEQALFLKSYDGALLNNEAAILLAGESSRDDWDRFMESDSILSKAIQADSRAIAAKINRGLVLNYFRLYSKAKPLFEEALRLASDQDAIEGLAIANQGLRDLNSAQSGFSLLKKQSSENFSIPYHEALRALPNKKLCRKSIDSVKKGSLTGFEKISYDRLKEECDE